MKKLYDLVVVVGQYEKHGETKKKWKNVGVIMEGESGPYMMLDKTFNPAGLAEPDRENIFVSLFKPKDRDAPRHAAPAKQEDFDDDIPFS